jgi:environmental stress-induced protein Ves
MTSPPATATLIDASAYRRMPWRNGLGTTTEIAVEPLGPDRFRWRLSIADVAESGPFSRFDGYDRVIAVVTGSGMRLAVEGRPIVLVDRQSTPHAFPGDAATDCTLIDGPIRDFNLIVDRATTTGTLVGFGGRTTVKLDGGIAFLHAASGGFELAAAAGRWSVAEGDTLRLDQASGPVEIAGPADGRALLATIKPR